MGQKMFILLSEIEFNAKELAIIEFFAKLLSPAEEARQVTNRTQHNTDDTSKCGAKRTEATRL
jgi:hypothetical protein